MIAATITVAQHAINIFSFLPIGFILFCLRMLSGLVRLELLVGVAFIQSQQDIIGSKYSSMDCRSGQ